MKVEFRVFQSSVSSWQTLFQEAADFASTLGPQRLICMSHSESREGMHAPGVVTVWYWSPADRTDG